MRKIISESIRLEKSSFELRRRRINWRHEAKSRVVCYLKAVCDAVEECSYPFPMSLTVHDKTKNEETIQLSSSANFTGVLEEDGRSGCKSLKFESEKGASLVISFASNGSVAILIYPYKSERYSRNEENIILYYNLSPDAVTDTLLRKCVSKYFVYIRNSSIYGSYGSSFVDYIRISWMVAIDIRNRRKLYRSAYIMLVEWSKLIGAGVVGYIVAVLTKGS